MHNGIMTASLLTPAISANIHDIIQGYSRFAPSQWETALLYSDVSHWRGASLESAKILVTFKLHYDNGVTVEQVRGLILVSKQCTYFLHMRCRGISRKFIFWESYYGQVKQWETLGGTFCQQSEYYKNCGTYYGKVWIHEIRYSVHFFRMALVCVTHSLSSCAEFSNHCLPLMSEICWPKFI